MKKIFTLVVVVLLFTSCKTSQSSFENFYQNHKSKSEFYIKAPAFLANLFLKDKDFKEVKPLIKKAKSYRLMIFDENPQELQKDFTHFIKKHHYKPLVMIKERKENVGIYALEQQNRIKEIVMNIKDGNSVVMMSIKTNLTYDEIGKMVSSTTEK